MLVLAITGMYSCTPNKGTSTGNPLVVLNMTGSSAAATAFLPKNIFSWALPTAYAFPPPASTLDASGSTVILSDFWINISEIEFKMSETTESGEIDGSNVEFAGPYLVNLFSLSPSTLASGELVQNQVRRIKYKTKKVSGVSGGNPAGMNNNSIYLAGSVAGKNFSFTMAQEITFESAGTNLVTFNNNDNFLLQVQTSDLIRKINLTAVNNNDVISDSNKIAAANPCPLIDASAADIFTCFKNGIQQQTKLGKDVNGDNSFDSGDETVN